MTYKRQCNVIKCAGVMSRDGLCPTHWRQQKAGKILSIDPNKEYILHPIHGKLPTKYWKQRKELNIYANRKHIVYPTHKTAAEHSTWLNMKARCEKKNNPSYRYYGAKGITVSLAWSESFDQFYHDMGPKPESKYTGIKGYSIDRIDNSKGYSKDNCRWATFKQQTSNH